MNPPEMRAQENERYAEAMATSRTNPAYKRQDQMLILIKEDWHVLIQHTGYWSKLLVILIKEDWHVFIQHT